MSKIKVILDPEQRREYIDRLLALDGLSHIKEDENAAYCPISLTLTPEELKQPLKIRQDILMNQVLNKSGLTAYDPATAPYSPDINLTSQPNEVYVVDSGKVVGARFFVGHNILPSTGFGVELEKAKMYNRVAVVLMDKNIRISRMQPHRVIYLEYHDFARQAGEFIPVFELLKNFEPGMGYNGSLPALLGFEKNSSKIVDLEELVYTEFPHLQYKYDGSKPVLKLKAEKPDQFF